MKIVENCRIVSSKDGGVTQSYISHCNKKATGNGWALGTDVVGYVNNNPVINDATAHTAGTVVKVMTGMVNMQMDSEGFTYGNYVIINHGSDENGCPVCTMYCHLDKVYVHVGQNVEANEPVGRVGNTGRSYGAHIHFEVRRYRKNFPMWPNLIQYQIKDNWEWLDSEHYLDKELPIKPKRSVKKK